MKANFMLVAVLLIIAACFAFFAGRAEAAGGYEALEQALRIYKDCVNEAVKDEEWSDEYGEMSLIYIDDDDIPELVIVWSTSAAGIQIYTVSDGKPVSVHLGMGEVSYIDRQNIFVAKGGRMGHYYDTVYSIQNGEFKALHTGQYGEEETDDEEIPFINYWRWDDAEVSESEYEEKLGSVFDGSIAMSSSENACNSAADMLQQIETYRLDNAIYECYDRLLQKYPSAEAISKHFGGEAKWQKDAVPSPHDENLKLIINDMEHPGIKISTLGYSYEDEDCFFITRMDVKKAGLENFLGIDIGSAKEDVIKTFGPPRIIEGDKFIYHDSESESNRLTFTIKNGSVAEMKYDKYLD